jgi:inorganic phosphate transporter, PiT family
MEPMTLIIIIVCLGLIFDYTNGFHDAANVVSTVIATGVLAPLTAILMAGVLNTIGATQISGVAKTITVGLVDAEATSQVMVLCAVFGAIVWNVCTWFFGIPSSSSYALVGGIVGAAIIGRGSHIVIWHGVLGKVVYPMIISPIVGFGLAYLIMKSLYFFLKLRSKKKELRIFRYLQMGSAAIVALSHGLNDAQKSMGIITLGLFASGFISTPHIPLWVIFACAIMMGLGTASGGFRIIRTMGFQITKLEPVQGFSAELGASCVILAASYLGMPVSSTHMIVGSIAGVGAARGREAVQWKIAYKLVGTWIFTLPGAGLVAAGVYKLILYFHLV